MAMQAAILPSCLHVSPVVEARYPMQSVDAIMLDGRGQRGLSGRSVEAWQGRKLGVAPPRRRGGIPKAEQAEVGSTTITTSAPPPETRKGVTEVDKDTFWPVVESAGQKVVVLDMYTQWCGPCKMMLPKIVELSGKLDDVIFVKLDCNQHNKPLAKELGIRVVPTFKIFKYNKLVREVTGAKFPDLVSAIEEARKSQPA